MEYRKITSNEDWRELWLGKFSAEMKNRGFSEQDAKSHFTILSQYLTANTGNPREIGVEKMIQFVKRHKDSIQPLMLFYDAIAHSEKHCAALAAPELIKRKAKKNKKTSS